MKLIYLILLFPCIVISQNDTKQIAFSHLSIADGLSQNSVISIAQDSIGYMWFATQDGLNRYDGNKFKIYNKQFEDITRPTFSNLGKIYIDRQNRIWIITNSGHLELYNSKKDDFEIIERFKKVSSIFQDTNNNLYIGTYENGLYKVEASTKDTLQLFRKNDFKKTVYDFHQNDDAVFVAASNAVYKLNENNYTEITTQNKSTNYSTIVEAKDGTLWFGSYGNGLFYKKKKSDVILPFKSDLFPDILSSLNIEDLLIDKQDRLWVATYGNGAFILDFNKNTTQNFLENKTDPFAVHYNDMLSLYQDNTGIVWLGSDGAGANYYDEHLIKFNVLTNRQMPKSVNIDVVRSITSDSDNNMWIGTSGKGLTFVDTKNKIYKTSTSENTNLASNRIISLSYQNDELWIGHQGYGLNLMSKSGEFQSFPEISNYTIWRIIPHSKNKSWLCTESNGLILFDKNEGIVERYNTANSSLTSNNIKTLVKDDKKYAWVATENHGVFQLNLKSKKIIKLTTSADFIKSLLYQDAILWIGTYGNGLKKYNLKTKEITSYSTEDGLPNNVVYGILPDDNGNLWLSTNIGLSKFSLNPETANPTFENYNDYDGLQALEFNTGAYYKAPNGTLYFGGLDGINWFHPNQLTQNMVKPKTIISGLELFNKPIDKVENKVFNHSENTITFTYTSLHFSQPERNKFKYKLINNDENWINAGNNHTAHYTNLPPNSYQFQVISSNYDGIWNNTPSTYSFKILKPWYLTFTAKLSYFILFLISSFLIYKYFKWRWQIKMQLQVEHKETERLKQLDEFKTKLYTNISHEFRTPLTLISGPIDHQLSKRELKPEDRKELHLVKQNANRLLNLVNQMLDLSMIDSGQIRLKVSQDNLNVLLKQIVAAFQYKADEKYIKIKSSINNLKNEWYDTDIIEKIATNLLSNAIKYAPEKSVINFDANAQGDVLVLSIININRTISKKDFSKLFQRFYQDDNTSDGVGVGLALVKELVTLSKGSIIANTLDADKIQFTVTLPIKKEAFSISEIKSISVPLLDSESETLVPTTLLDSPILLIVEDDKDIREFIASIFKKEYQIMEAENGLLGVKLALKHIPDIIISDIMMPKQDGIMLCNELKYNELTSHIPIILLTAKVGDENEIEGLKTGADAYITKPFNHEKLKLRVRKLIENRQQLQKYFSKDFTINPEMKITSTEAEFLKRLKKVLDKDLINSDFSSENFADAMQMSRTQLHRKLKAIVGMSSSEFIRSQRVKLAIPLLKESDATISEIAYKIGFNTPSYFIKCFKEVYHCTPNEYDSKN